MTEPSKEALEAAASFLWPHYSDDKVTRESYAQTNVECRRLALILDAFAAQRLEALTMTDEGFARRMALGIDYNAGWDAAIKALRQVDDTYIHLHTDYSLAADYLEANKPKEERTQQKSKLLVDMTDDELQIEWRYCVITEATGWGESLAAANEFRRDCEHELRRRGLQLMPSDTCIQRSRSREPE